MLSLTTPIHFRFHFPPKPVSHLNIPPICLVLNTRKRAQVRKKSFTGQSSDFVGFLELGRGGFWESSWCCWCKERSAREGDSELEEEILEFMEKSAKPGYFPTKKELVEAGRLDLVEAIKNRAGWFTLGWESDDEGNEEQNVKRDEALRMDFDIKEFQKRVETCEDGGSLRENEAGSRPSSSASNSSLSEESSASSNHSASSSGRPLEIGVEEDSGIDGILSRLEKERSSSFGINLGMPEYLTHAPGDNGYFGTSRDVDRMDPGENSRCTSHGPNEGRTSSADGNHQHYTKPDTWRSWSLNRAGFNNTEFEAAEISYNKNQIEDSREASKYEIIKLAADVTKALDKLKETDNTLIQTRLQNLELELASALNSLRFKSEEINSKEVLANSSRDLQTLSDAVEFQENELMSSQERLRSIRAKLAVVEGKMALAIRDAEKILEEKQRRIDGACKTLALLRTAYIVWPSSASEVLLAGSFDGWTTQRKMEKSQTGVFSVCLRLYPGRYEIKFIVDGKWRIDPLRPIVNNNGYENNLLIIT
ncbi:protein PTST homolog 2, chloroplastic [Coffea eugenioides]|uniref:Protein PTST homolog 2, chloroplastic-like n=1 Tax=Coffea arabica TaxID=13443 RepID=A0A6P6V994_COFAR|nr:protein PTST homolog 2, chloroplastic-like [Coffea arabica]XP_027153819.1 protein PTST homolog 2, chloroplastic [Coffea eugenioides]